MQENVSICKEKFSVVSQTLQSENPSPSLHPWNLKSSWLTQRSLGYKYWMRCGVMMLLLERKLFFSLVTCIKAWNCKAEFNLKMFHSFLVLYWMMNPFHQASEIPKMNLSGILNNDKRGKFKEKIQNMFKTVMLY